MAFLSGQKNKFKKCLTHCYNCAIIHNIDKRSVCLLFDEVTAKTKLCTRAIRRYVEYRKHALSSNKRWALCFLKNVTFFEKFCILKITKNLKNKERITAMLKQRLYNAKSNNESKQCATTGMPWSVCDFTGSVYSFNDCGEQKYAWSKRRLKC